MTFEPLVHPIIEDGYLVSPDGHIRCKDSDDDSAGEAHQDIYNKYLITY